MKMVTTDTLVTMLDSVHYFGTLQPGQILEIEDAFIFAVSNNAADGHMMAMDHVKGLEASIFYMDVRTHGKEFERYYQRIAPTSSPTVDALPARLLDAAGRGLLGCFAIHVAGDRLPSQEADGEGDHHQRGHLLHLLLGLEHHLVQAQKVLEVSERLFDLGAGQVDGEGSFRIQVGHDPERFGMALAPHADHVDWHLAFVTELMIGGLGAEFHIESHAASSGIGEDGGMAAQVQADHEVDPGMDQILQQLKVAELAVQDEGLVA